jgi:hypothetical protein
MVDKACIEKAMLAANGALSDKEMRTMLEQFERRIKKKVSKRQNLRQSLDVLVIEDAAELAKELKLEAAIAKRQKIINVFAARSRMDIINQLPDSPSLAITALNVGINKPIKGGRASVDARQKAVLHDLAGTAVSEMRKAGVLKFWQNSDPAFELLIGREMEQLSTTGGTPGVTKNPEALKIAEIMHKTNESARIMQNDAGAYIGKLDGYTATQTHDPVKLYRAGYDKWKEAILPRLKDGFFDDVDDPDKYLNGVYDALVTGKHFKVDAPDGDAPPTSVVGSRAKRASQHRVLHFKSFDDWNEYNKAFGTGGLRESLIMGWERAAKNIGIMSVWGTNPRHAFEQTIEFLKVKYRDNPKAYTKLNSNALINQFDQIDGSASIPGNVRLSGFAHSWRAIETMASLGAAMLSSLTDSATVGAEFRYQTGSFLEGHKLALEARIKSVPEEMRAEVTDLLGAGLDGLLGNILSRFDASDAVPGKMTSLMQTFFRLNGQQWWDDSGRRGFGLVMARELAMKEGTAWDNLAPELSRVLSLYDIGKGEWDLVRQFASTAPDGRKYITPDVVRDIPDEMIVAYRGGDLTAGQMRRTRDELEQKLRMYFMDRSEYAILKPGARERAIMNQGLRPGTPMGEAARMFWQFKSFSVAFLTKAWGRELYGRGQDGIEMGSVMQFLAPMILTTTALGYVAGAAKDLARGKEARDPRDFATWQAALVQGGGLGIYGDYIFGKYNRFGGSFIETAAGPAAGTLGDVARLYAAARDAATGNGEPADAAAKALKTIQSNTPFINLFYLRPALDYAVLYDLQEAVNPGSLRRMERRIKEENGQKFYMPPSTERARPITGN